MSQTSLVRLEKQSVEIRVTNTVIEMVGARKKVDKQPKYGKLLLVFIMMLWFVLCVLWGMRKTLKVDDWDSIYCTIDRTTKREGREGTT